MKIALGIKRQQERPDIHKPVARLNGKTGGQSGFGSDVTNMILDLRDSVPGISTRQLATLVGVSRNTVMKALDESVELEEWDAADNEASAAAELEALTKNHDFYKDAPRGTAVLCGGTFDADELSDRPVMFTAPAFSDPVRKADQSDSHKSKITLPTTPFSVAA